MHASTVDSEKLYLLAHQNICILNIDFQQQKISGYTELLFVPLKLTQVTSVKLNAKQCQIVRLLAKGSTKYYNCDFTYNDPLLEVVLDEQQSASEKTLKKFSSRHQDAVICTEIEHGNGEIIIQLPEEVKKEISDGSTFKIFVEYFIEKPQGGLQFVTPAVDPTIEDNSVDSTIIPNNNEAANPDDQEKQLVPLEEEPTKVTYQTKFAHLFTYKNHNSSRLWFPCIDSFGQPCTWLLEFTVESHMMVISCGDLVGTHSTADKRFKTHNFELNIPTAAPNIGFVVGQFDAWICPGSAVSSFPIKNYFLSGLEELLPPSCGFLDDCAEFYDHFLTFKYPYSNYKQVFVDQAYEQYQSYATMAICDTNLLHSKRIIDQAFTTRSILADALATQYFGCFISASSWSSAWLTRGISLFISAQYKRSIFGNNDYRYNVQKTVERLIDYEQKYGGIILDQSSMHTNKSAFYFSTQSPHTISPLYDEVHKLKSFLVMRMLEDRIGKTSLVQVFNKILSLASNASQQPATLDNWGNMLISTPNFDRSVFQVTGKDREIASFLEHWVYQGGHAKFNGSFTFDRKRNVVELSIKQSDTGSTGIRPYFGPITVTVQELDGTFPHKLNIEENKMTPFVITCHSKSRRNKKKKIPLCTGEEIDMDLSMMESHDSPVLWIRIDPDIQILRQIVFEQPDYNWQYQLKYERDVTAQMDSLKVLINHPTVATRKTLMEIVEDERCFYKVRCTAALNLTKIANELAIATTSGSWQAPTNMINVYKRMFGSYSCPHIIRLNNFSLTNLQSYFLQKTLPKALAGLRMPPHRICPTEVLKFIADLLKYNDNTKNSFSDVYYRAALIEALAETLTPVVVPLFSNSAQVTTLDQLPSETKLVAEEITRCLNLEKILPGYRYVVTVACLKAVQQLQRMGHVPSNPGLFRNYTKPNVFFDVRCAAVVQLVDIIRAEQSYTDLEFLLNLVENDSVPAFKYFILTELVRNCSISIHNCPNHREIRERLWTMMNTTFAHDSKLRCATADVFHKFYWKSDKSGLSSGFAGELNHKSKKKKKKKDKDKKKSKKIKEKHNDSSLNNVMNKN